MIWNWLDDVAVGLIAGLAVWFISEHVRKKVARRRLLPEARERRVVFPFVGGAISYAALDAALRLAHADDATLVPAYLARVPLRLSLDAAIPRQGAMAVELLEAVEQRSLRAGVPVDSRVVRGRSAQHALQRLVEDEPCYRMVLPAASGTEDGLDAMAIAWCLDHAPGEIVVLRPGSAARSRQRFPRWDNREPVSGEHQARVRRGQRRRAVGPGATR